MSQNSRHGGCEAAPGSVTFKMAVPSALLARDSTLSLRPETKDACELETPMAQAHRQRTDYVLGLRRLRSGGGPRQWPGGCL